MPFNLSKKYNELLDIGSYNESQRRTSLLAVFERDFVNKPLIKFLLKNILPTPINGAIEIGTLYTHLTTEMVDVITRKREFDHHRSIRLHWVRFHLEQQKKDDVYIFSTREKEGMRTYIYDNSEKYVVVLEPRRDGESYYLLTAYYVRGKDAERNKFMKKYKRREAEIH